MLSSPAVADASLRSVPSARAGLSTASQAFREGRYAECAALAKGLLQAQPDNWAAKRLLGGALFCQGRIAEAIDVFQFIIQHVSAPLAEDWFNLASALDEAKRPLEAEPVYQQALRMAPENQTLLLQYCALLRLLMRHQEAMELLRSAYTGLPATSTAQDKARLLHAMGVVAGEVGQFSKALPWMDRALALCPEFDDARLHRAMCALAEGDNAAGWAGFESRWGSDQGRTAWRDYGPPWQGDELDNRILLVWEEQGFGDTIQFARYLPLLRQRYPKAGLLLVCRQTLHPVLAAMAQRCEITLMPEAARPGQVSGHDLHIPLMSLPLRLGVFGYPVVNNVISVPDPAMQRWASRVRRGALQVGLVWSGTRALNIATRRNLALQALEPLLKISGIDWHSLQLGQAAGEIALSAWQGRIVDWSHHLADFGETAGLLSQLDLLITVDTSVAHLAASLGRPVWMLSRHDNCWRWLLGRDDSPWYPSMRLFRQTRLGDWLAPVGQLEQALAALAEQGERTHAQCPENMPA